MSAVPSESAPAVPLFADTEPQNPTDTIQAAANIAADQLSHSPAPEASLDMYGGSAMRVVFGGMRRTLTNRVKARVQAIRTHARDHINLMSPSEQDIWYK